MSGHGKRRIQETSGRVERLLEREVVMDLSRPKYWLVGSLTSMREATWRNAAVTVREELPGAGLLAKELEVMKSLAHPQLLLLMGFIPSASGVKLIFEYVELGSLYTCLHETPLLSPVRLITKVDVMLQITDALVFLHSRGLIHRQICSHTVQLVSYRTAKLGGLEWTVRTGTMCSLRAQSGWRSLVAWAPPELVEGGLQQARTQADIYSLCCVLWEVVTRSKPWGELTSTQIVRQIRRGAGLPLHRSSLPRYLYRLLQQGLVWDEKERDLDLQEVRDMLLVTRREQEETLAGLKQKRSASDKEKMSNAALQSQVTKYMIQEHLDPVTSEDSSQASEEYAAESDVSQNEELSEMGLPTYPRYCISGSIVGKYVGDNSPSLSDLHTKRSQSHVSKPLNTYSIDTLHSVLSSAKKPNSSTCSTYNSNLLYSSSKLHSIPSSTTNPLPSSPVDKLYSHPSLKSQFLATSSSNNESVLLKPITKGVCESRYNFARQKFERLSHNDYVLQQLSNHSLNPKLISCRQAHTSVVASGAQQPNMSTCVLQPNNLTCSQDPNSFRNFYQPRNFNTTQEQNNSTISQQLSYFTNTQKLRNFKGIQQPRNLTGIQQTRNFTGILQPRNFTCIQQPRNFTGILQKRCLTSIEQPSNFNSIQQPIDFTGIQQSRNCNGIQEPRNFAGTKHPRNIINTKNIQYSNITKQLSKFTNSLQSIEAMNYKQPINVTCAQQSKHICTQWFTNVTSTQLKCTTTSNTQNVFLSCASGIEGTQFHTPCGSVLQSRVSHQQLSQSCNSCLGMSQFQTPHQRTNQSLKIGEKLPQTSIAYSRPLGPTNDLSGGMSKISTITDGVFKVCTTNEWLSKASMMGVGIPRPFLSCSKKPRPFSTQVSIFNTQTTRLPITSTEIARVPTFDRQTAKTHASETSVTRTPTSDTEKYEVFTLGTQIAKVHASRVLTSGAQTNILSTSVTEATSVSINGKHTATTTTSISANTNQRKKCDPIIQLELTSANEGSSDSRLYSMEATDTAVQTDSPRGFITVEPIYTPVKVSAALSPTSLVLTPFSVNNTSCGLHTLDASFLSPFVVPDSRKVSSDRIPSHERRTSTPLDKRNQVMDFFAVSDRQSLFLSAMLQADERNDADLNTSSQPREDIETDESSSVFQTCLEVNTTDIPNEDFVASSECQTRITNVTFKNSVEEFSASSLVSATTERSKETEPGEGLEDLYCDDELNNSMLMDSHMQLLGSTLELNTDIAAIVTEEFYESKFINDATTQTEEPDTHCKCGFGSQFTEKANYLTELDDWGETEANGLRPGLGFETADETINEAWVDEEGETLDEFRGIYSVENINKSLFHTVDESLEETWNNPENEVVDNARDESLVEVDENINNMYYECNTKISQSEGQYDAEDKDTDMADIENISDFAQFHTMADTIQKHNWADEKNEQSGNVSQLGDRNKDKEEKIVDSSYDNFGEKVEFETVDESNQEVEDWNQVEEIENVQQYHSEFEGNWNEEDKEGNNVASVMEGCGDMTEFETLNGTNREEDLNCETKDKNIESHTKHEWLKSGTVKRLEDESYDKNKFEYNVKSGNEYFVEMTKFESINGTTREDLSQIFEARNVEEFHSDYVPVHDSNMCRIENWINEDEVDNKLCSRIKDMGDGTNVEDFNDTNKEDGNEEMPIDATALKTGDNIDTNVQSWQPGDQCVARWEVSEGGDGGWYRAVVDSTSPGIPEYLEPGQALVTFTEYGNSAVCELQLLQPEDTEILENGSLCLTEFN